MKLVRTLGVVAATSMMATTVLAANVLQIDIDGLRGEAVPTGVGSLPFSTSFTGDINLSDLPTSALVGMLINGNSQTLTETLADFTGTINLMGGTVIGGSFSVTDSNGDVYSATIVNGVGNVNTQAGQGFTIDGLTFMGTFTSATFGGVDVSDWFNAQPLRGSFLQLAFNPNSTTGVDNSTDIDIFVVVPMPAPIGLASAGLIGLAAVRRRR